MFEDGIDKLFAYVVCFVFVLIVASIVIPISINNIIAMNVERDIKKLPLPQGTQIKSGGTMLSIKPIMNPFMSV